MRTNRLVLVGLLFLFTPLLSASAFYFSGNFSRDDEMRVFEFSIAAPTVVTMQSWGYGGPTDPVTGGPLVGGFATVFSMFDSLGNLAGGPDTGGVNGGNPACGPRGVDPATNFCLDAYIQEVLGAGLYRLVLTEFNNLPIGTKFSQGFDHTGQGNFTGPLFGPGNGGFYDLFGNSRTSRYVITVSGVDSAKEIVPEPSTISLTCLAIALAMRYRKRRITGPRQL